MGFENRVMVVVTQMGKLGTILQAKQDAVQHGTNDSTAYSVQTLLGRRDEPLLETAARRLSELMVSSGCRRPLVLSLGLKRHDPGTLRTILEVIMKNKVW